MLTKTGSINPTVLASLGGLRITARMMVEGFLSGLHRSPHKGFNVEFTEHRPYQPGDEPRNIDWKVYGRTGRYFVKQFEEDTSMRVLFVLDCSASMEYGQKWLWAKTAAACLCYLAIRQGDWAGLVLSGKKGGRIPPGSSKGHLSNIISMIDAARPYGDTKISETLSEIGPALGRRGLVVVISDLLDDPESFLRASGLIRHGKHDMLALQVLDRDELEFPFTGRIMFTDMEGPSTILTSPLGVRSDYLRLIREHISSIQNGLAFRGMDHAVISTAAPLEDALSSYLARRMKRL